jgi:magnesium and cobalt transporter
VALRARRPDEDESASHLYAETRATLAPAEVPLGREERRLLRRLLANTAILVSDIMTPWSRVNTVPAGSPDGEVASALRASGHSRLPVVESDRVVGVVTVKDTLAGRGVRPVHFVRRETTVQELLDELREARTHLAVVVDRFGRAVGIVTVEDVLEEIVGELYDEREAPR